LVKNYYKGGFTAIFWLNGLKHLLYYNFKTLFPRFAPSMAQSGSSWGQKEE